MKRIIPVLLILVLLLATCGFAEDIEAIQVDWTEDSEQQFVDAGYSGIWYTLESVGCTLIIPDAYEQREPTEEELEKNAAYIFTDAENGGEIVVLDSLIEDADDLLSMGTLIAAQNSEALVQYAVINGTPAIITGNEKLDSANIIFDLGGHRFIQILYSPMSKANQLLTACMCSIQFQR